MAFLGGACQVVPILTQAIGNTATTVTHNLGKSPDFIVPVVHAAAAHYCTVVNPAVTVNTFTAIADAGATNVDFYLFYLNPL